MGSVHSTTDSHNPFSNTGSIAHRSTHLLTGTQLNNITLPSHNLQLQYSVFSHRGFYPNEERQRKNEDSFCIKTHLCNNPDLHFFGVFDGHGKFGAECSNFVSNRLVEILSSDPTLSNNPSKAFNSAILATNSELRESQIDDRSSGTTAIAVLVKGDTLFVANVGDSRAVIGVKIGDHRAIAQDLSKDHKPYRDDEYERLKGYEAVVITRTQLERLLDQNEEHVQEEEEEEEEDRGERERVWVEEENGGISGLAFSRSLGDFTAEKSGVIAEPEVSMVEMKSDVHRFFVIASDGVFDRLSSQAVVTMVERYVDPRDACAHVAGESYKRWLQRSGRTDDITIIVVNIKDLNN